VQTENAMGILLDSGRTWRPGTDSLGARRVTYVAIVHGNDLGAARTAD
jgi:hypothetical protein